jgi:hypothetical protein
MATARDIIEGSLRLLGAISGSENASAAEISNGILTFNDLLDSWANEKLTVHKITIEEFDLVVAQQSYTFGTAANFNSARPIAIDRAYLKDTSQNPDYEYPIEVISAEEWGNIQDKALTSSIPCKLYAQGTFPSETVYIWPIPTVAHKLVLHSRKPFTAIASASDTILLPPGYAKALKFNLAIDLAPEYGRPVTIEISSGAIESKENIKRNNIKPVLMSSDFSPSISNRRYDINIGE